MATVPVLDPIDSRSIGQDAETLRFRRLEGVRARQRARRHRMILVVVLAFVLSSTALLALTNRPTVSGAGLRPSAAATMPAAITSPVTVPAAAPGPDAPVPAHVEPIPARVDEVKGDVIIMPRPPAERARAPQRVGPSSASFPSRPASPETDGGDGTAAIDWLLKTSRRGDP